MPPKRPRRTSPAAQGLSAGERLKRTKLSGNDYLAWNWVGTEVTSAADITSEHRLTTCGFSSKYSHPFCPNKYSASSPNASTSKLPPKRPSVSSGELEDDIIVVSDDESPICDSKTCKSNPHCLNYLGQEKWENEGALFEGRGAQHVNTHPHYRQGKGRVSEGNRPRNRPHTRFEGF